VGTVFRKTATKSLPDDAELFARKGEQFARWRDAKGRVRTAPITKGRDGNLRIVVEARTFTAKYRDGSGIVREVATGSRDEMAARSILADLERRAERVHAGIMSAAEDSSIEHQETRLADQIDAYVEHQKARGVHPTRLANANHRLNRIADDCRWRKLADLDAGAFSKWLALRSSDGMSAPTRNEYRQELMGFVNWCVRTNRLVSNQLLNVPRADAKADRRRQRRALTEAELSKLLLVAKLRPLAEYGRVSQKCDPADGGEESALSTGRRRKWTFAELKLADLDEARGRARHRLRNSPRKIEELENAGRERSLIYKTMVLTGLRRGELESLTIGQLHLAGACPYAELHAADEKNRQGSQIPLRSDLAAELGEWISHLQTRNRSNFEANEGVISLRMTAVPNSSSLPANTPLFNVPESLVKRLDRDLKLAGIPKRDELGRTVDVHALRHCFGTMLSKSGVAPRTAQAAMRHSSLDLTMNVYTDPRLLDVRQVVESLPALTQPEPDRIRAYGTFGAAAQFAPAFAPTLGTSSESESIPVTMADDGIHQSPPARERVSAECVKKNSPLSASANGLFEVERKGVEPSTFALRTRRSPN
jgi:integrase